MRIVRENDVSSWIWLRPGLVLEFVLETGSLLLGTATLFESARRGLVRRSDLGGPRSA